MAELDVAVSFIQIIAFFLPAWAIMVQILIRLLKETDLNEKPTMIPLFGMGIAIAAASLYLFGRAAFDVTLFFIESDVVTLPPHLRVAANRISLGGLSFVSLGVIVLLQATARHADYKDQIHMTVVAFAFIAASYFSWQTLIVEIIMVAPILILIADLGYILWRDERPSKEEIDDETANNPELVQEEEAGN